MKVRYGSIVFLLLLPYLVSACSEQQEQKVQQEKRSIATPAFLARETDYYLPDSLVIHVHKPYAKRILEWSEHPVGRIVMQTNNMGFREDEDTSTQGPENTVRVLVAGDSHIDGVVNNVESFPNVLEQLLNDEFDSVRFEVINGGTGYYDTSHYLQFLKKYLHLKPALYIVVIYTGNDFMGAASILEQTTVIPSKRPPDYHTRLADAREKISTGVGQVLNQIFYFKSCPVMQEKVLDSVISNLSGIQALCRENKIRPLFVFLPTLLYIEPERDEQRLKKAAEALKLTGDDLRLNREIASKVMEWLSGNDIPYLDLYQSMKEADDPCFWIRDYHLGTNGHRIAAEAMFAEYRELFEDLERSR